jgi:hypothetical protein
MDMMVIGQFLWSCLSERWPEVGGAALQVIGGATVLFRALGSAKIGATSSTGFGMGKLLGWLGKIALNKG